VPEWAPVVELRGADEHCEPEQLVPGDSGALRILLGTYGRPTPELRVTLSAPGRGVVSEGRLSPGRQEGSVLVPIERVDQTVGGTVCIRTGAGGRTVLYGRGEQIRLDWLRPGTETRLALLPTIAHRFGLAKLNPFGSGLLLLVGVLLAAAWVVAFRTVLREVGS
jgi:hypothetical protein